MRLADWFNETVRHEPPRPMTREERCAEARELFIAKMRAHYGPDAERRIVRAIGRKDYERYGGPAVGDRQPPMDNSRLRGKASSAWRRTTRRAVG